MSADIFKIILFYFSGLTNNIYTSNTIITIIDNSVTSEKFCQDKVTNMRIRIHNTGFLSAKNFTGRSLMPSYLILIFFSSFLDCMAFGAGEHLLVAGVDGSAERDSAQDCGRTRGRPGTKYLAPLF